jgi:carboxymethylenebutenolidase
MASYEGMLAETVLFRGHEGDQVSGYLARPLGGGPYPGVVVIHEVFGLVPHVKEVARKMAAHGFAAIAPDLHHREGPGDPDDVASAVRAAGGVPDARAVGDIEGATSLLRSLPYSNGKVGLIGFCSGGRQTYIAACSIPSLDAAIDCYGGRVVAGPGELNERQPRAPVEMTEGLNCPLLGLFGGDDSSPSPEQTLMIEQELQRQGKTYEFHTYDDAGHAFFADYRPSYRQHAAVDGWRRVFKWFDRHLVA